MTFRRLDEFTRLPQFTAKCDKLTFVYGLVDPRDGTVRYIGVSAFPELRLKYHIKKPVNGNVQDWFWELDRHKAGRPSLVILARVCRETWEAAEVSWIGFFRSAGELYNVHDGGTQKGGGGRPKFVGDKHAAKVAKRIPRKRQRRRSRVGHQQRPVAQESAPASNVEAWLEAMARD